LAGYWLVRSSEPKDLDAQKEYRRRWQLIAAKYKATIIAGNGRKSEREGKGLPLLLVVKFPSYELAVQCYEDKEYQEALVFARLAYERELVIVESNISSN